jgi:Tol biopolymer transport system component
MMLSRRSRGGRALHRRATSALLLTVLAWPLHNTVAQGATSVVSLNGTGAQANGHSTEPAASCTGRFVAFVSQGTNIVAGDTNGVYDIFVRDQQTGAVFRASVATGGGQSNGVSRFPAVSADGRWVAFESMADNLVVGDTNFERDIFLHDRLTVTTARVSVSSGGVQGNFASGTGGNSPGCAVSDDGQIVVFVSGANNLVAGDSNVATDIFVRDVSAGTTTRVSVGTSGTQGNGSSLWPSLSGDGRLIAFASGANTLVIGDTNGTSDVFVHNRQTGQTTRVSVGAGSVEGNGASAGPSLSADGRYVAFSSSASNLVEGDTNGTGDVFVHDLETGSTERVSIDSSGSEADGGSDRPKLSADGSVVQFRSDATNLVAGDTNGFGDVFVHSLLSGQTIRVSEGPSGAQGNAACELPALSGDGRTATFSSNATTLVSIDANNKEDVFGRVLSSWAGAGAGLAGVSGVPMFSGTGMLVAGGNASLNLTSAAPSAPCLLLVSLASTPVPFKGGTLYAFPPLTQLPFVTNGSGNILLPFTWPSGVPKYLEIFFQYAILDAAAPNGVSLSNAVSGLTS